MKCYLFANVVVTDKERFAEYLEKVPAMIAQYGGRYLVRGGAVHPLEGDFGATRIVMLEFASFEAARKFYDSEEYAPMRQLRIETTQSQMALIDALGADYAIGADSDIDLAVHKSRM